MATLSLSRVDELVQSVSLHNSRRLLFNGYVLPFVIVQGLWIYGWIFIYNTDEYYDEGLVGIAAIGVLQILACLCCQWSVHIHCFLNCSSVSISTYITCPSSLNRSRCHDLFVSVAESISSSQYVSITWHSHTTNTDSHSSSSARPTVTWLSKRQFFFEPARSCYIRLFI